MYSTKVSVEKLPSSELLEGVKRHEAGGATFLHPFDCRDLIAGHASMGLEILEQVVIELLLTWMEATRFQMWTLC